MKTNNEARGEEGVIANGLGRDELSSSSCNNNNLREGRSMHAHVCRRKEGKKSDAHSTISRHPILHVEREAAICSGSGGKKVSAAKLVMFSCQGPQCSCTICPPKSQKAKELRHAYISCSMSDGEEEAFFLSLPSSITHTDIDIDSFLYPSIR